MSRADLLWLCIWNPPSLWAWKITCPLWTSGFCKNVKNGVNDNTAPACLRESSEILYNKGLWKSQSTAQMYGFVLMVSGELSAWNEPRNPWILTTCKSGIQIRVTCMSVKGFAKLPVWRPLYKPPWLGPARLKIEGSWQRVSTHRGPSLRPKAWCLAFRSTPTFPWSEHEE